MVHHTSLNICLPDMMCEDKIRSACQWLMQADFHSISPSGGLVSAVTITCKRAISTESPSVSVISEEEYFYALFFTDTTYCKKGQI